jgi:hypothetical protein
VADLILKANIVGFFRAIQSSWAVTGVLVCRNIDTTISVHFVCGFHIEIGNAYLPRSLHVEHPQRLTDDRKVLNFTPATVAKINGRALQHLVSQASAEGLNKPLLQRYGCNVSAMDS